MIMKKTRLIRCLSLFLTVSALASCTGKPAVTEEVTDGDTFVTGDTQTEEEAKVPDLKLINNSDPVFSITASEKADEKCATAVSRFEEGLKARYGCGGFDGGDVRILFEMTDGDRNDWSIKADGNNVTFSAGGSVAMLAAVEHFLRRYTFGTDMTLAVPSDLSDTYVYERDKIDNTSLLSYIPSESVKLTKTNESGSIMSPEWIDSLIMVELRPLTASIGGKLSQSYDLLDFYAEIGVNCIWLTPIYEYGPGGNGYGNTGVHRIGDNLTGTLDQDSGWAEMKKFVDHAHEKGIYILFDVITWGVMRGTELTKSHPEWFSGEAWGNDAFNWKNAELREWFTERCVENIMKTGADGFRCDCEPNYTGYDLFGDVRSRLAEKGKYIIIISEDGSDRSRTYDFEQDGVLWYARKDRGGVYTDPLVWFVDSDLDIVKSVQKGIGLGSAALQRGSKRGRAKYYTNCITNHDYQKRIVLGNRLRIGYAAITAPFIPLWYMGDEFNCKWQPAVQYDMTVNYEDAERPANLRFLEDVKRMITVRRTYKDIFEYWPDDHRNSNICAVGVAEKNGLTAYARYADGKAVLIVPNNNEELAPYLSCTVPFEEAGIDGFESYRVTELWSGEALGEFSKEQIAEFRLYVPFESFGMILIEGIR